MNGELQPKLICKDGLEHSFKKHGNKNICEKCGVEEYDWNKIQSCINNTDHEFKKPSQIIPNQKQLRFCTKCGIEEYKVEICKHCRWYISNDIMMPIPTAGLSEQGYCSKHKKLFYFHQPACQLFIKWVGIFRSLFKKEIENEDERWLKKMKGE